MEGDVARGDPRDPQRTIAVVEDDVALAPRAGPEGRSVRDPAWAGEGAIIDQLGDAARSVSRVALDPVQPADPAAHAGAAPGSVEGVVPAEDAVEFCSRVGLA